MKITTWNVNGIRSLKNIDLVLTELSSDVACFQETKVSRSQIPETTAIVEGYTSYFSYPRKQSGYSGVATYCKDKFSPEDAEEGLSASFQFRHDVQEGNALTCWELSSDDLAGFDPEGRVVTTYHLIKNGEDIQRLAIINVYCPRVDPEKLERHVYKMQFCLLLEAKMRELCQQGCSVIIVGDMNISHCTIDHCDPGPEHEFNSSEARQWLTSFLSCKMKFLGDEIGVIDTFRHFYPDKNEAYTCWNTKTGARQTNYGTRIDYILMSSNLLPILESCEIISDYQGSDHCPVQAVLKCDSISEKSAQLPSICTRLWPEFSGQQQKLKAFFQKAQAVADRVTNQKDLGAQTSVLKSKPVVKKNKQKSITNFFKTPNSNVVNNSSTTRMTSIESNDSGKTNGVSSTNVDFCGPLDCENGDIGLESCETNAFINNNTSKAMLLGLSKPPLCSGHKKESVLRTVEKKGSTFGRSYFMCAQSSNPFDRCSFFQWVNTPDVNTGKMDCENRGMGSENCETSSFVKNNSSSAWKAMLSGPPKPPLCSGHQKECVLRTVKKKGPNCGRSFFLCAQPVGHLSNPDASCNFFQWVNAPKVNALKKL